MKEGQPSSDQLYKVIGSIYADAYLRIEFLENENKTLRQSQHEHAMVAAKLQTECERLMKEIESLRSQKWNNGNANSMLPELLQDKSQSESTI